MTDSPSRSLAARRAALGHLGEALAARWLVGQGWAIAARRWTCRWGELDLVARAPDGMLAFVEVKTRSPRNWDRDGLLAIAPRKQAKLARTAAAFLADRPAWAESPCRFDAALVQCDRQPPPGRLPPGDPDDLLGAALGERAPAIGQWLEAGGFRLALADYLSGAFDLS